MAKRLLIAMLGVGAFVATSNAAAQANPQAEALFQSARALVEKGRYSEACPKLEESQRLEPAVGTQFNLADCYEHIGKTASAHALFREVASIAHAAGKFEREKSARERMAKLEPNLARLRLVVKSEAPGLELFVDGKLIDRARLGDSLPVDPGNRVLSARAPGRTNWEGTTDAKASSTVEVTIPELVDPNPAPSPLTSASTTDEHGPSRTLPLVIGGVGAFGIAVGAVFGAMAIGSKSDADSACPKDIYQFRCPTEAGAKAWNDASTQGTVSTIGFVVGGVALATAAVLWIALPGSKPRAAARGLLLEGTF